MLQKDEEMLTVPTVCWDLQSPSLLRESSPRPELHASNFYAFMQYQTLVAKGQTWLCLIPGSIWMMVSNPLTLSERVQVKRSKEKCKVKCVASICNSAPQTGKDVNLWFLSS